jgi:DNA-directed RNA polymerase subunit RPC12/RpoP
VIEMSEKCNHKFKDGTSAYKVTYENNVYKCEKCGHKIKDW